MKRSQRHNVAKRSRPLFRDFRTKTESAFEKPQVWECQSMKICIFGAGAIGGFVGAQLASVGADVSLVARGPHLKAMRENGLRLRIDNQERAMRVVCTDDPAEVGPQDYIFIALKAHSIPAVVDAMQPLMSDRTSIVTAVNGIPYWYFYQHGDALAGTQLRTIDPSG